MCGRGFASTLLVLACLAFAAAPAEAQERLRCNVEVPLAHKPGLPAQTFDALCKGLAMCWQPPEALAEREGVEVTVLLLPGKDGAIVGRPRRTYSAGVSTLQERANLFIATIDGIRRCPARMSPELAGRIAGHRTFLHIIYKTPKHKGS